MKVLVVGGVSLDRVVYLDTLPSARPHTVFSAGCADQVGSTGTGKALNLARLGFEVRLHAQVGTDAPGQAVRSFLAGQPVRTEYWDDPRGTETHVNLMDSRGGRLSIYTGYPTFDPGLDLTPFVPWIEEADYVVINIMNYARHLIPLARSRGKKIWCDLHDYDGKNPYCRDFLEGCDCLFVSGENLGDPEGFLKDQIAAGKELAVCTLGSRGSLALNRGGEFVRAGIGEGYPVVDTNGAGDAYFAGFLYGASRGLGLEACVRYATVVGGLCVGSRQLFGESLTAALADEEFRNRRIGPAG